MRYFIQVKGQFGWSDLVESLYLESLSRVVALPRREGTTFRVLHKDNRGDYREVV